MRENKTDRSPLGSTKKTSNNWDNWSSSSFDDHDNSMNTFDQTQGSYSQKTSSDNRQEEGKRVVSKARRVFLFIVFLAAFILSGVIHRVTRMEEADDFKVQFINLGEEVIEASNANVRKAFRALETLSVTVTGMIKEDQQRGSQYPAGWVKIPDTEFHLTKAQQNAGAFVVGYMPHVDKDDYDLWNQFSVENQDWIAEANKAHGIDDPRFHNGTSLFHPFLHKYESFNKAGDLVDVPFDVSTCSDSASEKLISEIMPTITKTKAVPAVPSNYTHSYYVPVWQLTPAPHPKYGMGLGNFNLVEDPIFKQIFEIIQKTRSTTFFDLCEGSKWFNPAAFPEDGIYSLILSPVFDHFGEDAKIVGTLSAVVTWSAFFRDILVKGSEPIHAVMKNKCGDKSFTYRVDGEEAVFLGHDNDAHDPRYDHLMLHAPFADFAYSDDYLAKGEDSCTYTMSVYPTRVFQKSFFTKKPIFYGGVVMFAFFCTTLAFLVFDWLVQRQQKSLESSAARQNALVSSLFPKSIQRKLLADIEEGEKRGITGKAGLRRFLSESGNQPLLDHVVGTRTKSKPIAELFPKTTIMFADIAGFTAWSSTREPTQVFTLLESIYSAFDQIAHRRRVFKVETIGDCYVAVCGVPDPREEHAVVMARFARDCMRKLPIVTEDLEQELGPDTSDLCLRIGLHSGSVVAGVLRGDKSRFQLFGDTMNTAARMESTSERNRIQISQETATLLTAAGKSNWFIKRNDKIMAKGKGELQTFWLESENEGMTDSSHSGGEPLETGQLDLEKVDQTRRLARWTSELLSQLLKDIVASRNSRRVKADPAWTMRALENDSKSHPGTGAVSAGEPSPLAIPLDEVEEIIMLPEFDRMSYGHLQSKDESVLTTSVVEELNDLVLSIALLYNDNPFHNFRHANHVTMSASKLLSRIVAPELDNYSGKTLHDHTYGITSDPLTRFTVIFSALIHDVDHCGVPNAQMVKESAPAVSIYGERSVAEQNSVDICWNLMMEPRFENLRRHIYVNKAEFKRFRQLMVNTVLATDIMDQNLKALRNKRWEAAFSSNLVQEDQRTCINRKATIVIEHLIQASDVAHTMQHWHVYRQWNENLFRETYKAFIEGRAACDPTEKWYEGEIGFLDYYVIPLAKKLKDCGVFGVSSDEYLSYAIQNRREWEQRGAAMVQEMSAKVRQEFTTQNTKVTPAPIDRSTSTKRIKEFLRMSSVVSL